MPILDFTKAFNTVPIDKILGKLQHYGIQGPILDWISIFLKSRDQCVVVDGEIAEPVKVDLGVPQGIVLGPLLFPLLINDIPDVMTSKTACLFFDDC